MKRLVLSIVIVLLASPVWGATANFIVPFNADTRETMLPKDADGRPLTSWWALSMESDSGTIIVQVRGDDAVLEDMKSNPDYCWLADINPAATDEVKTDLIVKKGGDIKPSPVVNGAPKEDPTIIQEYISSKITGAKISAAGKAGKIPTSEQLTAIDSAVQAIVDNQDWSDSDAAIQSAVKLHGQTIGGYKGGGLGPENQ